ncbi:MAG: hypothetical protein VKJ66_10575 [Synechococcus sp.]|nr:hypothetical protein [Synechococcus sp.]
MGAVLGSLSAAGLGRTESAGSASAGHPSQVVPAAEHHEETWEAMEVYFECITTCSLDDGECVTRCVEELREHH